MFTPTNFSLDDDTLFSSSFQNNDTGLDWGNSSGGNLRTIGSGGSGTAGYVSTDFAVVAKRELRWALILHTYGFGCLFFILAFYTFFSVLNLRSFISSRPFMSTINGFICLLGVSRSSSLLIDPYGFKETMPRIFGQVVWDVGFPGIISAFCLVQLAFLQLTQFKLGPQLLRRKTCLSLIITAHFILTVAMDILVALQDHLMIMKYIVQYIFLSWGILLCCTFLYSGYKVMLLIRKIPAGFQRDLPDPNHKGIMQLAMLAPYNNLAGSVTAALLPTLCAPKIHQQDVATSCLGFRNDPNSRILESESIPILEEVAVSSGDETSPLPPSRTASFQNQTRASHKFNLKPKLSLQASDDEAPPVSPRSPAKSDSFAFPSRSNPALKGTESFVTTKDIHEFKSKIQSRTCFENENYRGVGAGCSKRDDSCLVPNIMISCPSGRNSSQDITHETDIAPESSKKEEALNEMIHQIQQDLKEMNIERDGEERRSRKGHTSLSRKSSGEGSSRKNSRRDSHKLGVDMAVSRRSSGSSAVSQVSQVEEITRGGKEKRRQKSLSWRKSLRDEESGVESCLLSQEPPGGDVSLTAILNHIAYVNRANMGSGETASQDVDKARRSEMEWVLNVTYVTAMWGLMLCLTSMSQVQANAMMGHEGSHGIASSRESHQVQSSGLLTSPWPWLWFQTFCRALELAMGCAMANITRQPTANSRYPHTLRLRHRDTF